MSSPTLAQAPTSPDTPEDADSPRTVPQRRLGRWTAAVVPPPWFDTGALYPFAGKHYARGSERVR
ncbi:hypothetical protein ABZT03_17165 [Streptomyces sp. NPDC005574]|uniref:hypothetical protein n=1 Tax=Streptomyces sp. NPDC005574 TaxID=3156891 RepID=UPI0033AB0781